MSKAPRLRMFAGPNGSGKSTIKDVVESNIPGLLGVYVNPDEMEKVIRNTGCLDLSEFQISAGEAEVIDFFGQSSLLQKARLLPEVSMITVRDNRICFGNVGINSYWASVASDFIRHGLLKAGLSFTFETVMSSPDKIDFLCKAQQTGFRTCVSLLCGDRRSRH